MAVVRIGLALTILFDFFEMWRFGLVLLVLDRQGLA